MPPKFKYNRDEIILAALELVREQGEAALTARALASRLGSSPKPMFTLFNGMDDVRSSVIAAADELYSSYLAADIASGVYPPYKASGMGYIRFAREEKQLFSLLFLRNRSGEQPTDSREDIRQQLEIIMQSLGLDEDRAFLFHIEMWIFVHGIASMIATGYLEWDMDFVSKALTDMYQGLKHRFCEEEKL